MRRVIISKEIKTHHPNKKVFFVDFFNSQHYFFDKTVQNAAGGHTMTIQQCRYVLKIIECGSFNEAAKQLFVAQSSLSVSVKGLETELTTEFSKEGVNLSGGESQKLAIARVFYKDAGLMILDEPSSALDPIAEYQLNHAMLKATGDKTVIFISHRLSTTRIADRIIMLENGHIVEEGSHEDLLALGGKYARMWKVQAGAYISV